VNLRSIQRIAAGAALIVTTAAAAGAAPAGKKQEAPTARPARPAPQVEEILDDVVDRLWDRADWYWHEGRYEERVAIDRLIIRMEPGFIEPYGTAGWLLESLGRDQDALAMYRQGVATVPERWETHHDLAMFYYQHKQYPEAAAEFRLAAEKPNAPGYVWKMLAHAYEHAGDLQRAVAAWEGAARVAPNDPAVAVNLRRVQARLHPSGDESGKE
jgi:tetratricopeptide (TPR) repeat protein